MPFRDDSLLPYPMRPLRVQGWTLFHALGTLFPYGACWFFGLLMGMVLLMVVVGIWGDTITESWTWRDLTGVEWSCTRVRGWKSLCERHGPGQLVFATEDMPTPVACEVREWRVR